MPRRSRLTCGLNCQTPFLNGVGGQLTRETLAHYLREATAREVQTGEVLVVNVEIDDAYFGGQIRPHDEKAKRVDRRIKKHQTGNK